MSEEKFNEITKEEVAEGETNLTFTEDKEKDEVVVKGKARGHDVVTKCVGMNNLEAEPVYTASVDGFEEFTGRPARKLFEKYYSLAKLENI